MLANLCCRLSVSSSLRTQIAVKNMDIGRVAQCHAMLPFSTRVQDQDQEVVSVLRLNMLRDNPGAVKKKRRVGRGIGSSKGKTCGRGHKGQKSRSGGSIPLGFEGGQTKLYKLLPKRGFKNTRHAEPMIGINVGTIQDYIDMGRLVPFQDSNIDNGDVKPKVLSMKDLVEAGVCTKSSIKHGVKLLAKGKERLTTPFHLKISRASEAAIQAVEYVGGQVTTVHYNRLALRSLLSPEKFARLPKQARPPPKLHAYYTDWDRNRGYLSVQAQMREFLQQQRPDLHQAFHDALEERQRRKAGEGSKLEAEIKK